MRLTRKCSGYTLIEAICVTGIMGLVLACTAAMLVTTMKTSHNESVQTYADSDAMIAMQAIVQDVREAKSVKVLANKRRLSVTLPALTADGYYDKSKNGETVDYFLSSRSDQGAPNNQGPYLWRGKSNQDGKVIKRNITDLTFEMDDDVPRQVMITIVASEAGIAISSKKATDEEVRQTKLIQRVVYMRNYKK